MRYHNITKDDMKNGDGLRVVLWVAGCEHHCPGCQNPMTWDPEDGILFDEVAKQEIFQELDKPWNSGITFSGGDPLHSANYGEITKLAQEIKSKYPNKTIWLYTGGTWEDLLNEDQYQDLLNCLDVLVDGEFIMELNDNSLMWKGSSNQRVIDVQASLVQGPVILHCGDHDLDPYQIQSEPDCCG